MRRRVPPAGVNGRGIRSRCFPLGYGRLMGSRFLLYTMKSRRLGVQLGKSKFALWEQTQGPCARFECSDCIL